jgi:uncharacterized repeat protein (TIGR03803 family)
MKNTFQCAALVFLTCGFALGQAQYQVLWSFGTNQGLADGAYPNAGLVIDGAGNLYGTSEEGGAVGGSGYGACYSGCGTVFELSPSGGFWTETVLYDFCTSTLNSQTCPEGAYPSSGLIFDKTGNLYGTANVGPNSGNVFELSPSSKQGGNWTQTVLWSAEGLNGQLTFDNSGNLYGTTDLAGAYGSGSVFELSPPSSPGGSWTPTTLYSFCPGGFPDCPDGWGGYAGVTFDKTGNLYGMAGGSGNYSGLVYMLSPTQTGDWSETVLYGFTDLSFYDVPDAQLALDPAGNVYGTAPVGGRRAKSCKLGYYQEGCGGAFELVKNSGWRLREFVFDGADGGVPVTSLYLDYHRKAAFGTTELGGTQALGTIYQIVEGKGESVLYNFCSQPNCTDGSTPGGGGALLSESGRLYGTAFFGGTYNQGVVFEISP